MDCLYLCQVCCISEIKGERFKNLIWLMDRESFILTSSHHTAQCEMIKGHGT